MAAPEFDMRNGNSWGRAIYADREDGANRMTVSGCITPLPEIGSIVIQKGSRWKFVDVKHMGNPRDGFFGTVELIPDSAEGRRE